MDLLEDEGLTLPAHARIALAVLVNQLKEGLTPKQNSTGEKDRLGWITKQGDTYLGHLLVIGARNVVRYPRHASGLEARLNRSPAWMASAHARRHRRCQQVGPDRLGDDDDRPKLAA